MVRARDQLNAGLSDGNRWERYNAFQRGQLNEVIYAGYGKSAQYVSLGNLL